MAFSAGVLIGAAAATPHPVVSAICFTLAAALVGVMWWQSRY